MKQRTCSFERSEYTILLKFVKSIMSRIKKIIIFGAGGNSRDVIDTINDINDNKRSYKIIGILDDDKSLFGKEIFGVKVLGPIKEASNYSDCYFNNGIYSVVKFFSNKEVIERAGVDDSRFETIIHPTASISRTAQIGPGCFLSRSVVLTSGVKLGRHVVVHPGVTVSHDSEIGDFTFIANSSAIGGYIKIGQSCFIGANSTIRERVSIGDHCIIGMGSVILKDIPKNGIYVGNPARLLRKTKK